MAKICRRFMGRPQNESAVSRSGHPDPGRPAHRFRLRTCGAGRAVDGRPRLSHRRKPDVCGSRHLRPACGAVLYRGGRTHGAWPPVRPADRSFHPDRRPHSGRHGLCQHRRVDPLCRDIRHRDCRHRLAGPDIHQCHAKGRLQQGLRCIPYSRFLDHRADHSAISHYGDLCRACRSFGPYPLCGRHPAGASAGWLLCARRVHQISAG